jgi:hypothetical protein
MIQIVQVGQQFKFCGVAADMMAGFRIHSRVIQESDIGLTAKLTLAGPACNTFGLDISDLTIEVTYQSQSTYIVFQVP